MTAIVQFSWSRLEGLGLIAAALGWGLLAQFPPTFFTLTLLTIDFEQYFLAIIGTIFGSSVILATIACSLAEDWNDSTTPTLKSVTTSSLILFIIFICGFFIFFLIEPLFPPDFSNLDPTQRYFSAMTLALTLIGVATFIIYKSKGFFTE
ncbi:MAG: hypothetical protein JSW11_06875 [Candidatus Heimdallarchaeota archaeon]|nr:MAG: hypothetical protein JSW11_06875 [Candidatus Heimdallarchaeota archaeon]